VTVELKLDTDGDGHELPADCDDTDPDIYPGAPDDGIDGIDSDCDGVELCYVDADGDGDGVATTISSSDTTCTTTGVSLTATDCDDADPTRDNLDLDGDDHTTCDDDCNDADSAIHPDAGEIQGDSVDQNCDGWEICYVDADGDGDGSNASHFVEDIACSEPGNSLSNADCDDNDPTRDNLDLDGDGLTTCGNECDDTDGIPGVADSDDEPDTDGIDGNCDGIDGDIERSVFVDATNGSESNTGLTPDAPVQSLATAFDLASVNNRDWILIAGDQAIGDASFERGIHLAGGYEASTWDRTEDLSVLEITTGSEGLQVEDWGETETEWHQIEILGDDAEAGESTYALTLRNTQALTLVDSRVIGGIAADGEDGTAGLDGAAGTDGEDGINGGHWSDDPICEIDEVDTYPHPGEGGESITCTTGWGGDGHFGGTGGAVGYGDDDNGHDGDDGFEYWGDADALGGAGGNEDDGEDGEDGVGDIHGSDSDVAGGAFGDLYWPNNNSPVYTPADGEAGTPGRGGGGGGAGSGFPCPILGSSGGGGGGGGCGADEGTGGTGGHISVAVVLDNSAIALVRSTIEGGDGGYGGNGGNGGNGSGGGGGPSVGVYCVDTGSSVDVGSESLVLAGTPGMGGDVPGTGTPGEPGMAIDVSTDCTFE
jgi:hypothetical protein